MKVGRFLAVFSAGLAVVGCASAPPPFYSLHDDEIYIASRPHFINVEVAGLKDRRPAEEITWAAQQKLPSDLAGTITERMVQHLRVSNLFSRIRTLSGPSNSSSIDRLRELNSQGTDAILVGDLNHFYGHRDPTRQIEGHVEFMNLKLISTRTGQPIWQGTADKFLRRQERNPGPDKVYAGEALRGAINQLAIQLANQSFPQSDLPVIRHWRVGILIPEDSRPPEEKDIRARFFKGNRSYSFYNDPAQASDLLNEIPDQWAKKLRTAGIFQDVIPVHQRSEASEKYAKGSKEGLDAVLVSRLARFSGAVIPAQNQNPYMLWSGGMGYPRVFKATAQTRIEDVRLIETKTGKVLWTGEAEYGIDRTIKRWESPMILVQESLDKTLDSLVHQALQAEIGLPVVVVESPPAMAGPSPEPPPEMRSVPEAIESPVSPVEPLADIYFDFDKYNIRDDMRPILDRDARWLEDHPGGRVIIEGHCDDRGTTDYNLALGERRARTVMSLLKVLGIEESRLSTISYGEEHPVCSEQNEDCYAKNRRVHLQIH